MKKLIIYLFLLTFLSACQATREGFTLKKKDNSDEFLVEKKSPLVLPPVYGKLPTPDDAIRNTEKTEEFKEVISSSKNNSNKKVNNNKSSNLEDLILDKIK